MSKTFSSSCSIPQHLCWTVWNSSFGDSTSFRSMKCLPCWPTGIATLSNGLTAIQIDVITQRILGPRRHDRDKDYLCEWYFRTEVLCKSQPLVSFHRTA